MAFDLALLTSTPDMRAVPPVHARLVCAMRYAHVSRRVGTYSCADLARYLGSRSVGPSFHVFMDETGHAWPEPIMLNPPCQAALSYDEMLLIDLATAAARNDRASFDGFLRDMVGEAGRNAIWFAARRMMRHLVTVT